MDPARPAMQIVCPNCSTKYDLPDSALGAGGRKVRCKTCGHVWFQQAVPTAKPEPEAKAKPKPKPPPPPPPPPDPVVEEAEAEAEDAEADFLQDFAATLDAADATTGVPHDDGDDLGLDPPDPDAFPAAFQSGAPDGVPQGGRRASPLTTLLGASFVLVIATIGVGAVMARDQLVQAWPPIISLYELAGLPVQLNATPAGVWLGAGLRFVNIDAVPTVEDGFDVLTLTGEVLNTSQVARTVPPLVVTLTDQDGGLVQQQDFRAEPDRLAPTERGEFRVRVTDRTASAVGVTIAARPGPDAPNPPAAEPAPTEDAVPAPANGE